VGSKKDIRCPLCSKRYKAKNKQELYDHMEKEHSEELNGLSPAQYLFNHRNKKSGGKCVMCGKETNWNEKVERYERFCSEKCRKKYREEFKKRMKRKYGKTHLLDSPEKQKEMLSKRKISGTYTWEDGYKHSYCGSYEKDFLNFMENFMQWENPSDIMMPAPQIIPYQWKGKRHFYIPDVYITSINTLIEIKSNTNKHYRARDLEQEKEKDKAVEKIKDIRYIKILEKDYEPFVRFLVRL